MADDPFPLSAYRKILADDEARAAWVKEILRQSLVGISLGLACDPPRQYWPRPDKVEIGGLEWDVVKNDAMPEDVVVMRCGRHSVVIYNIGKDDE